MIGFSLFFVILQYIFNITMKYFEVEFTLTPCTQVAQDLLSALAGEVGFETFEETENGLTGYVQQSLFDESASDKVFVCKIRQISEFDIILCTAFDIFL